MTVRCPSFTKKCKHAVDVVLGTIMAGCPTFNLYEMKMFRVE